MTEFLPGSSAAQPPMACARLTGAGRFIREPTRLMKHKCRPVIKKRCYHRDGIIGSQQTTVPMYLSRSNGHTIMRVRDTCALPVFRARSCRFNRSSSQRFTKP